MLKLLHNPWPDLVAAAYTGQDVLCDVQSDFNLQLYCLRLHVAATAHRKMRVQTLLRYMGVGGKRIVAFPFKYNECSYLQREPQLISTLHIILVEHPEEFDNIGVVREGFEDVVLRFDLLINVLKNKVTIRSWLSTIFRCQNMRYATHFIVATPAFQVTEIVQVFR